MRALVIGFGSIGRRHAANLQRLIPDLALEIVTRQSAPTGLEPAARVHRTIDAGLATKPDLAVIATPSNEHAAAIVALLEASIPAYIEKPVVTSTEEIAAVRRAMDAAHALPSTLVGCNLRFLPSLARLRELIAAGAIGTLVRAAFTVGQWLPDWRPGTDYRKSYSADSRRGGGVILDLIHEIDQVRWHLGEFAEFDRIAALAGKLSALEIEAEDTAVALLGRTGGPFVTLNLDYVSRRPVRRYEFVGDGGTLIWDLREKSLALFTATGTSAIDCGPEGFDVAATYPRAMQVFLDVLAGRRTSPNDLAEGLRSTELALAIKAAPR